MNSNDRLEGDLRETVKDAGATGVTPWMAIVAALATTRPTSMRETFQWLADNAELIEREYERGKREPLTIGAIPEELRYEPELGYLDRSINDHWLRGRRIFGELLGNKSFMQAVVLAISGVELAKSDSEMLEQFAMACMTLDRGAWPMAATRRVAGHGGGVAAAVVAGAAMMGSPMLAGAAAANCARFLRRAARAESDGVAVERTVRELLANKERVMGFGRPVVGPDERSPVLLDILRRYRRAEGTHVTLLVRAEQAFFEQRGLKTTAAAWAAAILSDLELSPDAVHAVCNHWVTSCVFAQAAFGAEHAAEGAR